MFTRPAFAALGHHRNWVQSHTLLQKYNLLIPATPQPLSALFEAAWSELRTSYRTEYVYKNEIANRIVFGLHSPKTASLYLEFPVGRSIVDVAIFNGTSTAYEIKTEFDSARRLHTQTSDYAKIFEKVFVICHPELAENYAQIVRTGIGVYSLKRNGSLSLIKPAHSNISSVDPKFMFRTLRREEYLQVLAQRSPELLKLPNGIVGGKCMSLFAELEPPVAHNLYVNALRRRRLAGTTPSFLETLPSCLRALGCGVPLSTKQQRLVVDALSRPLDLALA